MKTKEEKNAYFKEYRKRKGEELRTKRNLISRKWRMKRKKLGLEYSYHNKKVDPVKQHARKMINYAIQTGRIKRGKCVICKKENAQAHHEDYSHPLKVIWLCAKHHNDLHRVGDNYIKYTLRGTLKYANITNRSRDNKKYIHEKKR